MPKRLTPEQIARKEEKRRKREERRKEAARKKKAAKRQRNHLRPLTDKQLKKRAAAAARAAYKPTMVELNSARKRNDELIEKRRADTAYFRDWLDRRLDEYDQSARTTETATEGAISQSMTDTRAQYDAMRDELLTRAQQYGSGTNLEGYSGFNTDTANQQAQDQLQLSREQLSRLATVSAGMRTALSQNSAAYLGSLSAREEDAYRNADTEIRDARTKTLAERAALQSETYLKLKNLELDKAEIRFDRKMSKAELRLKKASLRLDRARIDADLSMNAADNATDVQVAGINNQGGGGGGGGGDPVDQRAKKKNTREMNTILSSSSQVIRTNKKLRRAWNRGNLSAIRNTLATEYNFPAYLFPALFSLMRTGRLSKASKESIRGAGGLPRLIQGVQKLPRPNRGDFGR